MNKNIKKHGIVTVRGNKEVILATPENKHQALRAIDRFYAKREAENKGNQSKIETDFYSKYEKIKKQIKDIDNQIDIYELESKLEIEKKIYSKKISSEKIDMKKIQRERNKIRKEILDLGKKNK